MTTTNATTAILEAIQHVVGPCSPQHPIVLHEPDFRGSQALKYVTDCIETGWVSTAGKWVCRFEQELASFTGAEYAIAVSYGSVALRLALYLVGVRPEEEVLVPP